MDDATEQQILDDLKALGAKRKSAETELDALGKQSTQAAKDALKLGIRPSKVARSLEYTDGYIRKLAREAEVPPDPRYAEVRPPSRAKTAPEPTVEEPKKVTRPPVSLVANPFPATARVSETAEARERRHMKDLRNGQSQWFKSAWQATDGLMGRERTQKIIAMAVEAGHLPDQT